MTVTTLSRGVGGGDAAAAEKENTAEMNAQQQAELRLTGVGMVDGAGGEG
jgi:hypothetical protein